ncbi:hypothetical protein EOPP23_08820 [Endozoicomonas sp. OPT23]|uniref:TonB-dependent hemoglobin/transferrin/lactoferrin family receptor n=1 Tax=Endozoicomonas sp. OPT23 TaxID=2072845 RepID=UPI00129BDA63|nr:TonB-dependent hemoglobin/transferrin/lactoferrin family receptor [Endozoicomonas sp. OPT23]MRI33084.1 hypothetical protein [Endozoicomonas sp. OPT23]
MHPHSSGTHKAYWMFTKSRLAVAVMAISSGLVYADQPADENVTLLDQITVSATRSEKQVGDIAGTVSVISEEQIENQLSNSVEDVLRYEPGVTTEGSGRLGFKGFNIRGMSGNRVKVLLDGVSMASTYQSGSEFLRPEQDYVDVDSLKSIEIVKGPSSTLYGSDALGGVVAFVSKAPADYLKDDQNDTYTSLKGSYSSVNKAFTETATLANRNGSIESLLVYTRRDGKETENHSGADIQGLDRGTSESLDSGSNNILADIRYKTDEHNSFGLKVDWLDQKSDSGLEATVDARDHSDDSRIRRRVSLNHIWQGETAAFDSVDTKLTWQKSKSNQITYTYGSASLGEREKDYFYEQKGYQFSSQFDKSISLAGSDHHITYGISAKKEDLENDNKTARLDTGEVLPPDELHQPGRYSPLATNKSYGFFLQDEIGLGQFTLTPGIRYDNYKLSPKTDSEFPTQLDENKGDSITAKLGAIYDLSDNTTVFALYSQGFRAPTLDEAYYAYENIFVPGTKTGYAYLANPDLKPEESDSFELGVRFNGQFGVFEITGFHNKYKNFIEEVAISNSGYSYGAYQNQNISNAVIEGFEIRGEIWADELLGMPEGTSINFAVAKSRGANKDANKPLESIAPVSAVLGLNYDHTSGLFGGALNLKAAGGKGQSDIENTDRFETAGYGVFDLTGYYKPVNSLTLRAGLFNITDKEYWKWEDIRGLQKSGRGAISTSAFDRYSQPGRNFSVSAKYEF